MIYIPLELIAISKEYPLKLIHIMTVERLLHLIIFHFVCDSTLSDCLAYFVFFVLFDVFQRIQAFIHTISDVCLKSDE